MQPPMAVAVLLEAASGAADAASSGRVAALQLPPDAMHQCKLGTGDLVLVSP